MECIYVITTELEYLHTVVFIVHVLYPGNELARIEAVSHRFVLITLTPKNEVKI